MENTEIKAVLYSDKQPTDEQRERFIAFLKSKHNVTDFEFCEDVNIKDGFKLIVGDEIYDWTNEGRLRQLKNFINTLGGNEKYAPLLKGAMNKWKPNAVTEEIGTVIKVGDGVATVTGLESAEYGEILLFDKGVKGLALDLREKEIGCILFDQEMSVMQGSSVFRSGKIAGMPVGEEFVGRVIDALGNPIDEKGEIKIENYYPIEHRAPGIVERQPVNAPLETGILAIDSMFPIGRGQRELIIGDRQTGKTSIAVDTIINQNGKGVICIYVAIGQRASSIASIVSKLEKYGAMNYTIVVSSTASDPAPLQYVAPYAGCTLAEYFMKLGHDVLIIYDDLSKHAVAYRSLSLILGRTPGREAYPGDIFYLHSRLLERSAHMTDGKGGGSITALPIVETQAGDVSSYIPTNVISITDGQIYLESDLFFSGQRPAINVGLSVSRVGGNAQSKAVKSASGTLRIDLAQYREFAAFLQFAGDLDENTRARLDYGKSLMLMLRQKTHSPYSRHRIIIILLVCLSHMMVNIGENEFEDLLSFICSEVENDCNDICKAIDEDGKLTDEMRKKILEKAAESVKHYG